MLGLPISLFSLLLPASTGEIARPLPEALPLRPRPTVLTDTATDSPRAATPRLVPATANELPVSISAIDSVADPARSTNCENWNTSLFFQQASASVVKTCLDLGKVDVASRDDDHNTPLHWAARITDDPKVITVLVAAGADRDALNRHEATPLHMVASHNTNVAVLEALLTAGVDIAARNASGYTATHLAAHNNNNPRVFTILIDAETRLRDPIFDVAPLRDGNRLALNSAAGALGRLLRDNFWGTERLGEEEQREGQEVFLEAQIAGDVPIWGHRRVRSIAATSNSHDSFRWAPQCYATMLFRLRMLDSPSRPIRPPSFMPKITCQYIGFRKTSPRGVSEDRSMFVISGTGWPSLQW